MPEPTETTPDAGGSYIRTEDGGLQLVERTQEAGEQAAPATDTDTTQTKKKR